MTSPSSNNLSLVGVVHRDPFGEQRVWGLLNTLQCDAISLEVSEYALRWRIEKGLLLAGRMAGILRKLGTNGPTLEHGEIQGILHMLTIPFEVRVAARYASLTGAPYYLLDDSAISRKLLSVIEPEMITESNLASLVKKPDFEYAESIDRLVAECRRFLASEPLPRHRLGLSDKQISSHEKRDQGMAESLRRLMSDMPGKWVHICGFTHLLRSQGFENMAAHFPKAQRIFASNLPVKKRRSFRGAANATQS